MFLALLDVSKKDILGGLFRGVKVLELVFDRRALVAKGRL